MLYYRWGRWKLPRYKHKLSIDTSYTRESGGTARINGGGLMVSDLSSLVFCFPFLSRFSPFFCHQPFATHRIMRYTSLPINTKAIKLPTPSTLAVQYTLFYSAFLASFAAPRRSNSIAEAFRYLLGAQQKEYLKSRD